MPASKRLAEAIYREYMTFFEKSERTRRWNLFTDIPWEKAESCPRDADLALCAETFCGVEMYLPDYVAQGINVVRDTFGQAWFQANWGYEESKHSVVLREYLSRTGQRTSDELIDFEQRIMGKRWEKPFNTCRQMTLYGALQEMTTFVIYDKQKRLAAERGDELLSTIYGYIERDEIAHARFYEKVALCCLDEDPVGTKADLAHVFRNFTMPAYELVPEYEDRIKVMRTAGIDRNVFIREVWFTMLKRLRLTRHDLPPAPRVNATTTPPAA